ncbi:MAG TPA: hypothetical protein PK251_14495 [Candidatus Latescibacteria bacterium]|nr:hypothetical protein [Candidatus Latescibacterota bacterium]HOS65948.1 hypothetical protein [Candidatus Latescibacterota bacterium]HPK75385.1 hypothetical protein [Candidatus Latescibacterota bacterium]HQI76047.1 hypothetical protein [Candidatus Latescibacterota bacterium]HRS95879.1 hypothetical protein [Candidatus Latescibacterota bacterium]
METIRYKVKIPRDRTLTVRVPHTVPVGDAEVLLVISSGRRKRPRRPVDLARFNGSITLKEDPLAYQTRTREEW